MAADAIIEAGKVVRNTAGHRLLVLLADTAEEAQPFAGDVADVLKLCDPKAKIAAAFAERVAACKDFARANREGPKWVGLPVEATVGELRELLKLAGAKV